MKMNKEKVQELYELSKSDGFRMVNSDIRQLCKLVTLFANVTVWVIERNFRTSEMISDDWKYLYTLDGCNPDEFFTSDWNKCAKFYDQDSANNILGSDFPDHWNLRVVPHTIMEDRWA